MSDMPWWAIVLVVLLFATAAALLATVLLFATAAALLATAIYWPSILQ